ncbi:sigma-70 family RNA polymerase sigma factor [Streptomyces sp. NBC_00433]
MAEDMHRTPQTLTEEQAARMLADMNDVIRAGEEMRKLRTEMILVFAGFGWTQDKIARLTEVSQPAVSKQMARHRTGASPPPLGLDLDQHDAPWLEGRLWALADAIAETCDAAACARLAHAMARGRRHFTPQHVDELRRLVEEDLRLRRAELPAGYRAAYDTISRGLDLPRTAAAAPAAPASVRRTLARQVQRDRLTGG